MLRTTVIAFTLLAVACSGGGGSNEGTTANVPNSTIAVSSLLSTSTTPSPTEVSSPSTNTDGATSYADICTAAYEAGMGNAATQDRESWIADCTAECEVAANKAACDAMGAQLGIDR